MKIYFVNFPLENLQKRLQLVRICLMACFELTNPQNNKYWFQITQLRFKKEYKFVRLFRNNQEPPWLSPSVNYKLLVFHCYCPQWSEFDTFMDWGGGDQEISPHPFSLSWTKICSFPCGPAKCLLRRSFKVRRDKVLSYLGGCFTAKVTDALLKVNEIIEEPQNCSTLHQTNS